MKVREDEVEFADGSRGIYGVVDKNDAALIVPKISEKFILVKSYRYTIGAAHWEFPYGGVENKIAGGEEIARQELEEETGYQAEKMTLLAKLHIAYGYANQVVHIFLGENLSAGTSRHESGEIDMEVKEFAASEIESMMMSGDITDAQTIAAWALYKIKYLK
jgi:ADP-ribose pyrophosphatase